MVTLRPVEPDEVERVQALIEADPAYVERVTGLPPGPADAQSVLMAVPDGLAPERKTTYGVRDRSDELIGLVDLLRGWPDASTAYLGLLQVHPDRQREGIGRQAHDAVLEMVRGWPEIERLRLAVVATNAEVAEPFWRALGYEPAGDPVPYRYANLETTAQRYERPVADATR